MKRRDGMLAVTAALALSGCVILPPPPPFLPPPPPQAYRPPGEALERGRERDDDGQPMFRPGRQP
ncbi:hypothetical protein ACSFA2_14090 [Variovorax sp. LT2P21]|uniref:hypothetical protein n=1 Tax=Variovorax sp. LT2P21 TaxID=3443731 RepID=UPI003F46B5AC